MVTRIMYLGAASRGDGPSLHDVYVRFRKGRPLPVDMVEGDRFAPALTCAPLSSQRAQRLSRIECLFPEIQLPAPGREQPFMMYIASMQSFDQKPLSMNIVFAPTTQADADALVAIRIAAMRESLERIGRFDPQRARARFLASFEPALCRFIEVNGVRLGFFHTALGFDALCV